MTKITIYPLKNFKYGNKSIHLIYQQKYPCFDALKKITVLEIYRQKIFLYFSVFLDGFHLLLILKENSEYQGLRKN